MVAAVCMPLSLLPIFGFPVHDELLTDASVIAVTLAIPTLNVTFLLYICIAAIIDRIHGKEFLPVYPGESSLSAYGTKDRSFLGPQRTPDERTAMVNYCSDYIFRHSVFRKHA